MFLHDCFAYLLLHDRKGFTINSWSIYSINELIKQSLQATIFKLSFITCVITLQRPLHLRFRGHG